MYVGDSGKPSSPLPPSGSAEPKKLAPETYVFRRWAYLSQSDMERTSWDAQHIQATEIKICGEIREYLKIISSNLGDNYEFKSSFDNFVSKTSLRLNPNINLSQFDFQILQFKEAFSKFLTQLSPKDLNQLETLSKQVHCSLFIKKAFILLKLQDKYITNFDPHLLKDPEEFSKILTLFRLYQEPSEDMGDLFSLLNDLLHELIKVKDLKTVKTLLNVVQSTRLRDEYISHAVEAALGNGSDHISAMEIAKESTHPQAEFLIIASKLKNEGKFADAVKIYDEIKQNYYALAVSTNLREIADTLIKRKNSELTLNDLELAIKVISKIPNLDIKFEILESYITTLLKKMGIDRAKNIALGASDPATTNLILTGLINELIKRRNFEKAREILNDIPDEGIALLISIKINDADPNPRPKKME